MKIARPRLIRPLRCVGRHDAAKHGSKVMRIFGGKADVRPPQRGQPVSRRAWPATHRRAHFLVHPPEALLGHGMQQLGLAGEVMIRGGMRHPRPLGDVA